MQPQARHLRHLPFLEAISALDDSAPSAGAIRAGLLVLRLVDSWAVDGATAVAPDSPPTLSTIDAIDESGAGWSERGALTKVVRAMFDAPPQDMRAIGPALMAYAWELDLDAKWTLAIDVYDTVLAHLAPDEDSATTIEAYLRRGACLRGLGRFDDAAQCLEIASKQAHLREDVRSELRAELGRAKIAFARGNLPVADAMLAQVMQRAIDHSLPDVRSMVAHELFTLAFFRGEYDSAIGLAHAALQDTRTERERVRLLSDIAGAFYSVFGRQLETCG